MSPTDPDTSDSLETGRQNPDKSRHAPRQAKKTKSHFIFKRYFLKYTWRFSNNTLLNFVFRKQGRAFFSHCYEIILLVFKALILVYNTKIVFLNINLFNNLWIYGFILLEINFYLKKSFQNRY